MACHLGHKLPWASLYEIALRRPPYDPPHPPNKIPLTDKETKKIQHFARCLVAAITEFRDSDRSDESERAFYDPYEWNGHRPLGWARCISLYDSIGEGYVMLNLLLMDPDNIEPRLASKYGQIFALGTLLGHYNDGHPDEIADHLKLAFDKTTYKLKRPLTSETTKVLRDHAAMLFRSMYSTSGGYEGWLDVERVVNFVRSGVLGP